MPRSTTSLRIDPERNPGHEKDASQEPHEIYKSTRRVTARNWLRGSASGLTIGPISFPLEGP